MGGTGVGPSRAEMDTKRYSVRPFQEWDYESLAHLQSLLLPELPTSAEEEREWDKALERSHLLNEKWAVEVRGSGEVAAVAALNQAPYAYHPHKFWVSLLVDAAHEGQGVGRALASLLDGEAVAHRAACFWTNVRKDRARSMKFAAQQGFVELRTTWLSVLDLSTADPGPVEESASRSEREGIRFTTLAQEGPRRSEVLHRLFDLWTEASRDTPRMGEFSPPSFSQFEAQIERFSMVPEAFFLAAHGDEYVASSHLERDLATPDTLLIGFTGTRASYRGRGLATELKRRSIEYARRVGVRYLKTLNDSLNGPIWAINERLGFRRTAELSNMQRDFPPPPAETTGRPQ